jgi:hypothetical protein
MYKEWKTVRYTDSFNNITHEKIKVFEEQ